MLCPVEREAPTGGPRSAREYPLPGSATVRSRHLTRRSVASVGFRTAMRWHPEPEHTTAWSAVGGVVAALGVTSMLTLAFQPVPPVLVYACGALAVTGLYVMVAPLAPWWPWSSHVATPIVLVVVIGAIAALVASSRGGAIHAPTPSKTPAYPASESKPGPGTTAASLPKASVGRPARASMVVYNGTHFTAEVPAAWRLQEAEVPKSEGVESTWRNPSNPSDALLIDASPATNRTLQQDAAPVQEQLLSERGYDELYYGPGDLHGVGSWMWIWRISCRQRIDYFFHRCSTDFGVLGSTVVGRFIHLRTIFRSVAQSVRANCH